MAEINSESAEKTKLHQLLSTIDQFEEWALFEKGFHQQEFDLIVFAGAVSIYTYKAGNFEQLENFLLANKNQYITCQINYNLKNEFENLSTRLASDFDYPILRLVVPEVIYTLKDGKLSTNCNLNSGSIKNTAGNQKAKFKSLNNLTNHANYLQKIKTIKEHIQLGDVYELNYCMQTSGVVENLNIIESYKTLRALTGAPFGVLFKSKNNFALCASPERFLYKKGNKLLAQPMKGTIRRSDDVNTDEELKQTLKSSEKEQAENVMIVDLMRNDFSKIAQKGSVKTTSLFEVQSFKNVHQMISTVECTIKPSTTFTDILKATFPMGSMTGAPKIRALQLIDEYEEFSRDLFSGSLGYFKPGGDFDLNVVIRTVFYETETGKISFRAGSAITSQSDAEMEYEECLLKLEAVVKAVQKAPKPPKGA